MKKKTINAIISKKIKDWLESIEDESVKNQIKNDIIVTGGCITSLLLNESVNDFDIYLKTKESLKALCQYYCNIFNKNNKDKNNKVGKRLHAWVLDGQDIQDWKTGIKQLPEFAYDYDNLSWEEVQSYQPTSEDTDKTKAWKKVSNMLTNVTPDRIKIMVNSDGIAEDSDIIADNTEYDLNSYLEALADGDEVKESNMEDNQPNKTEKYKPIFLSTNAITLLNKLQIIVRFYGEPSQIHENYDFVHATNYWTFETGCMFNQGALEAILNKDLHYIGSKYPICSLIRTRKFIKRGWHINAGQFVKMSFQISELDLKDINVLEDQLVGVDSIYFLNFIKSLKDKSLLNPGFELTKEYLTTVIDRIFG
jgi:hypothetical protein